MCGGIVCSWEMNLTLIPAMFTYFGRDGTNRYYWMICTAVLMMLLLEYTRPENGNSRTIYLKYLQVMNNIISNFSYFI